MRMSLLGTPWRKMIALKIAIIFVLMLYKTQHFPYMGYQHLLVDYHFGFIKRALIGEIWSAVFPKVPVWAVFVSGGIVIVAALALYLALFRKTFGFSEQHMPLLMFTACSPMFFANDVQTIGYFDIYGCIAALLLLLMPTRTFGYVGAAALIAMLLIVIHHIHTLMYVPTLAAIVVARYYLAQKRHALEIVFGVATLIPIAALFVTLQFVGSPPIPQAEFQEYMESRMASPLNEIIDSNIWYQSAANEFVRTWEMMGKNVLRLPIYALILAAHLPLIRYFRQTVGSLSVHLHQRLAWLAVAGISVAYVVMCLAVNDWSRWFANWSVCMLLLMFALRSLPSSAVPPIADTAVNRRFGWIVALLPRIGSTIPF